MTWRTSTWPEAITYPTALTLVGAAYLLTLLFRPIVEGTPGLLFLGSVVAVAWLFGTIPACVAAVASVITVRYFVGLPGFTSLILFAVVAVCLGVWIGGQREKLRHRARSSEERYRTLVEMSPDAVFVNAKNRIVFANPAALRLFGVAKESDLVGRSPIDLVHPDSRPIVEDRIGRLRQGLQVDPRTEQRWVRCDGTVVDVESSAALVPWDGDDAIQVILRDVTERRRLEAQFLQSQKMEAIGRLAGGLAHDFNNLLTAILGYCDLLLDATSDHDPRRADLQEIREAGQRAAALTTQLLAFSRMQMVEPQLFDVNDAIDNMIGMLRRLLGEDVEVIARLDPAADLITIDAAQFSQVILNLVVNARDAMPTGGTLTIETRNVELDGTYVATHLDASPGQYVMLAVSDTGVGMTPEVQARLFEPFFTTKDVGKGTGLGLSSVYGIARQNQGHFGVYSEPGAGTTFKVYFPRAAETQMPALEPTDARSSPARATVLVVEDDTAIRAMISRMLERDGHAVLVARSPSEARRLASAYRDRIDLLLTDVVMPEAPGPTLAAELKAVRPQLRVLFMSGFTNEAIERYGIPREERAFLQKPFTPKLLADKVHQVLTERGV